ncbi:MAG: hypothetical protein LC650_01960 [Actinobacteria bacterium]|nr:hypothetical protein [Actinomycetota bacterium]
MSQRDAQAVEDAVRAGGRATLEGDTLRVGPPGPNVLVTTGPGQYLEVGQAEARAIRDAVVARSQAQQVREVRALNFGDPAVRSAVRELVASGAVRTPQELFDLAEGRLPVRGSQAVFGPAPPDSNEFFFGRAATRREQLPETPATVAGTFSDVRTGTELALARILGLGERGLAFLAPPQLGPTPDNSFFGVRAAQQRNEINQLLGLDVSLRDLQAGVARVGPALRSADFGVRGPVALGAEALFTVPLFAPRQLLQLARQGLRSAGRTLPAQIVREDAALLGREAARLARALRGATLDPLAARANPAVARGLVRGRPVVARSSLEAGLDPVALAAVEGSGGSVRQLLLDVPQTAPRALVTESGVVVGFADDAASAGRFVDPLTGVVTGDALATSEAIRRRRDLERLLQAAQDPRQRGLFPIQVIDTTGAQSPAILSGRVGGALIPRENVDDLLGVVVQQQTFPGELRLRIDAPTSPTGFQRSLADFAVPERLLFERFDRNLLRTPFLDTVTDPRAAQNVRVLLAERQALERFALDPRRALPAPTTGQVLPRPRRLPGILGDRRGTAFPATVTVPRTGTRPRPDPRIRTIADDVLERARSRPRERFDFPDGTLRRALFGVAGRNLLGSGVESGLFSAQDVFFGETLAEATTPLFDLDVGTQSLSDTALLQDTEPIAALDFTQRTRQTTETTPDSILLTEQDNELVSTGRLLTVTSTRPRTPGRTKPADPKRPPRGRGLPIPTPRGLGGVTGPEYEVTIGQPGNLVYVPPKRGGREVVEEAITIARNTAAATVKVKSLVEGGDDRLAGFFGNDFRKGRGPGTYVEKRNKRMNTAGELKQIQGRNEGRKRNAFSLTENEDDMNTAQRMVERGLPLRTARNMLRSQRSGNNRLGGGLLDDFF